MWRPEDWSEWPVDDTGAGCSPRHVHGVRQIVRRLPRPARGRALELTRGVGTWSGWLRARYPQVVALDLGGGSAPRRWPAGCDLILAVDTLEPEGLDAVLIRVHGALADGGVLVATLPARPRAGQAFPLCGAPPGAGLHEVELQYRLRRAGFQGLRLRRCRDGGTETLLCMAVRRGCN